MNPVLLVLVVKIFAVVAAAVSVASVVLIGRERIETTCRSFRSRLEEHLPYVVGLIVVIPLSGAIRRYGTELSWILGWNATGLIYSVENDFVATVQSVSTPTLTALSSFVYLYGYVFLLVFPVIAYFALDESKYFKELAVAYGSNYLVGVLLYTLVIVYGPRNVLPEQVQPLMYTSYPTVHVLTAKINTNTNVFPSLHTSLSVTVAAFGYRTRDQYPRWLLFATALAGSVVFSTMYLGIHWGTDVFAGCILGLVSVRLGVRFVEYVRRMKDPTTPKRSSGSSVSSGPP